MTAVTGRPLPARRSSAVVPAAAPLFLVAGLVAIAVYFVLPTTAQSVAYVLVGLAASTAIFVGALMRPRIARLPWYLFGAGILCEIGGDVTYSVYELGLGHEPPQPSLADVSYLAGYPLIALGIVLLVRQLGGQTSRVAQLDMAIVFVAVATVQWVFFVGSYFEEAQAPSARLVGMAYPSMGVLLLVGFVQLLVIPARRSSTYWLLIVSVALWVTADEVYGVTIDTYASGDWVDGLWLGSYVVWAFAALRVSDAELPDRDQRLVPRLTRLRIGMLGAALLAAPAAGVLERALHHRPHVIIEAIGASVIAILVLARLTGLLAAVERARTDERIARERAEEMQQQLTDQNERLVELDRLKDEFVASVSHELRTPLTSICGYAELLREDVTDESTRAHVEVVERNAGRLLELVNDLLFAARLQAGRLELQVGPVDLRTLVEETVATATPQAESSGVGLHVGVDERVGGVDGDVGRLGQVLANLVSNAVKFTPAGGRVDVTVSERAGRVLIEVADTGIGIPSAEVEQLFERFFRARTALDRQIPGTGLGLYISKAIVEAHGGSVAVSSVEGRGTTFAIELPAARLEVAA